MKNLFPLASVLIPFAVACGGGDDTGTEQGAATNEPNTEAACDPNAEIPCIEGIAEPCVGLESGYPGDEYCRAAPDPDKGFQAHVGPSDYDDPEDVASYLIHPGEETNWAEVIQYPNEELVYISGYWSYMRPGSHHFIMYGSDQDPTNGAGRAEAGEGAESAVGIGGRFIGGATKAIQNITLASEYPEDQGIGHEIPGKSYMAMNLHFVNVGNEPLIQELWVNWILIDPAEVKQYIKPITWYGGMGMNIPPGTQRVLTNDGQAECRAPNDMRLAMMTAHAHASTVRVTTKMNGDTLLFEEYDWAEPTEWRFTRSITNPQPDRAAGLGGAYSGLLHVTNADTFTWECEVHNNIDVPLTFGNRVYDGEMCMVFGFYIHEEPNQPPFACAFF
jgi:hypothetical protein